MAKKKTETTYTQNIIPAWYTNYAKDVLASQQALSNAPYQPYEGTRVAPLTADQLAAFDATRANAFGYQPALDQATSVIGGVNPMGGFQMAQPYLDRASQSSVANINQYMNPYIQQVVDRFGDLGLRTLQEKVLPGIRDMMISSGQFGGTRQAELFGRGVRDVMADIAAKQAELMMGGWNTALEASGTDLSRYGNIGQTMGTLYNSGISNQMEQAGTLAKLAQQQQTQGLAGSQAIAEIGAQQQAQEQKALDVAYQQYLIEQGYPQQQITNMANTMGSVAGGIPNASISSTSGKAPSAGTLSQLASLGLTGAALVSGKGTGASGGA